MRNEINPEAVDAAARAIWRNAERDITGRIDRESCDRVAHRAIHAAQLYLTQPARVLPSVEAAAEAVRGVQGVPFVGSKQRKIATAILALFASQPTVAEVARAAAEKAWDESAEASRLHVSPDSTIRGVAWPENPYRRVDRPITGGEPPW